MAKVFLVEKKIVTSSKYPYKGYLAGTDDTLNLNTMSNVDGVQRPLSHTEPLMFQNVNDPMILYHIILNACKNM